MKALHGIRLLDLTHVVSGPYAGMILADLGAETIKVEPPGRGEATRHLLADDPRYSRQGLGAYFITLNRNKKSMTLNLKSAEGRALFYELVQTADVVLDNFSAGTMARLQLDHERLAAVNPRLITCSLTGFGETGPATNRPAFDLVAQAMGGTMSLTGQPGGPPTRSGIVVGDLGGGLMAVIGILAALVARQQTGRGQHVDISMLDTQISLLNYLATLYLLSGEVPQPQGNGHFHHIPYNTYPCQDGHIVVAIIADEMWANLMAVLDAPDLDIEEHCAQPGRQRNRPFIEARLAEIFSTNSQAYWLERLQAGRVPCAPVNNVAQALADPQVLARQMVADIPLPHGGFAQAPGNPIRLSETGEQSYSAPPLLGQHTAEILRELGKSDAEIARLREMGII